MKKNIFYNILLTSSNLLFPLLTFPYLSRVLGAEGMGVCNFILSYGQNFIIVAALGLPFYGTREIAKIGNDKEKRSKLFLELIIIHFTFSIFLLGVYVVSIFLLHDFNNYRTLTLIGGALILLNVFSVEWLFSGVNDFKYITIRSLIIRILSIFAIFIFVNDKNDFINFFTIIIATIFFTVLFDLNYAKKYISITKVFSSLSFSKHIKPISILGVYMVLSSISFVLPTTLLGFFSTKSAVGYYYTANRIIRMIISLFSAMITVLVPHMNQVFEEKGKEHYLALVNNSLNFVMTFGVPISFFVFLSADPLVTILAGKDYMNTIFLIEVMSPIIFFVALAQVFVLLILSVNRKDKLMVFISMLGIVMSVLINLIFISAIAEKATALSQLIAEITITVISFFLAKNILDFTFPTKKLLLNLVMAIPFLFLSSLAFKITDNSLIGLTISFLFCSSYFLLYQVLIIKDPTVNNMVPWFSVKSKYLKNKLLKFSFNSRF